MIRKNRDSKFIIYQVLYIIVITVLALKGADLDLRKVVSEEESVDKSVRDSLVVLIDSLQAEGITFDINVKEVIETENVQLKEKLASINNRMMQLSDKLRLEQETKPVIQKEESPETKEQTKLQSPISITQTFIQNTWNIAENKGNIPTEIYDPKNLNKPIVVILPGKERKFDLQNQNEVVIKFGTQKERIKVVPNKPPVVKIERTTTKMDGSDIYVQELQRVTGYSVKIIDERIDQLKVVYSGPVSVNGPQIDSKGNLIYNVSLRIASNENRFDEWLDRNNVLEDASGRYKVNFFFTVVDERTKDRVQVGDSFYFTDFAR